MNMEEEKRIADLERRVAALEAKASPIPFLVEKVCDHCKMKYQTGWIYVCGAVPKCPHCGGFPLAPWEKKQ